MIALAVAVVALAVALGAAALSVAVARQSGGVASALERHRHGHVARDGTADPQPGGHRPDRRRLNLGAPRATGERRERPAEPTEELRLAEDPAAAPRPADGPEEPPTVAARAARLPRPGQIGRPR